MTPRLSACPDPADAARSALGVLVRSAHLLPPALAERLVFSMGQCAMTGRRWPAALRRSTQRCWGSRSVLVRACVAVAPRHLIATCASGHRARGGAVGTLRVALSAPFSALLCGLARMQRARATWQAQWRRPRHPAASLIPQSGNIRACCWCLALSRVVGWVEYGGEDPPCTSALGHKIFTFEDFPHSSQSLTSELPPTPPSVAPCWRRWWAACTAPLCRAPCRQRAWPRWQQCTLLCGAQATGRPRWPTGGGNWRQRTQRQQSRSCLRRPRLHSAG